MQPVFEAIAERANMLIDGYATTVLRVVGDRMELAAYTPVNEESDVVLKAAFPMPACVELALRPVPNLRAVK